MQIILPLTSFKLWEISNKINNQLLISPKSDQNQKVLGISIKNQDNFPIFFSSLKREIEPSYGLFNISIPSIKVDNSLVQVDSNDLAQRLAHLPGSALPGEKGNVFISGHSAISFIFNARNAIFAKLPEVKKGDEILVLAGGVKYTYRVTEIKVVEPTDLSVISPPDFVGRYISLMTCVPPGLNTKRLVVLGKMN